MNASGHLSSKPGFRHVPVAFDGSGRNAKGFGGFLGGQAAEKTEFDDTALLFINAGETVQCVVEGDDVDRADFGKGQGFVEFYLETRAAFCGAMAAGVVDQDLAHETRSDGYEMGAVFGVDWTLLDEAEISLMNQSGAAEGVVRALAAQVAMGNGSQFAINQRHEYIEGRLIPVTPSKQEFGNRFNVHQGRPVAFKLRGLVENDSVLVAVSQ
jgi:hypothetical protein